MANASDAPAPTLGLIGIGLMGTALAERLLHMGANVVGWDPVPEKRTTLGELGGFCASSADDVFARCERIVLSLPSHETVQSVLESAKPLLRRGQVIIDTSTGDPDAAVAQAAKLSELGVEYVDATVSGSSQQLREGTAVLLIGGTDFAYISCLDVFDGLTSKAYHTGPPGSGARMKLVTNLVLGLNRAALAEGLAFATSLGLNLEQTLFLLRESMAYSRIMDSKGQKMIDGDFEPQARLSQHLKDVHLMLHAAEQCRTTLPLTQAHCDLLQTAMQMGLGDLDNSAIVRVYQPPAS
jgi:3-hydroxyisobutyrate dehydrogenase